MADFSVNATNLSAPSGAGSQPVSYTPVAEPANNTVGLLGGLVDMFAKGAGVVQEVSAAKQKDALLRTISEKEAKLNTGVQNGEITPQEYSVRSRANWNEALASNPGMAGDITKLFNSFKASTLTGDTNDAIKSQRDQAARTKEKEDDALRTAGYMLTPTTTENERAMMWAAHQQTVSTEKRFDQMKKQIEWERTNTTWNQNQGDRTAKLQAPIILNDIAGSQLQSLGAELTSMQNAVKANPSLRDSLSIQLEQRFAGINATLIAAASSSDPSLANSYKPLFDGMLKLGQKMLDPKEQSESLTRELTDLMNRTKLGLIQDNPKLRQLAAISNLYGNNPAVLGADFAKELTGAMLQVGSTPVQNGQTNGYVPQIVGNPNIESGALAALREGVKQIQTGNPKNKEAANIEASNSVNNILIQTGKAIGNGATPQSLKGLAGFFSGSEYAYMIQKGQIDPTAAQAARLTFQQLYEPAVVSSLGAKLQDKVEISDGKYAPLAAQVDVKWNGAGFVFEGTKGAKAVNAITGLKTAEAGLTQLVRLGAHMEGTTNYEQYWEKNKHLFLPSIYPDPARLKVGEVVQGRKYIGGNVSNPDNWIMQIPK